MKKTSKYPVGKLPLKALAILLYRNAITDERVIVGPAIGEDAAVIDTGGPQYLIAKTDPITFATDKIGWYAVNINANDIATMGAHPQWFLATLLLPESRTEHSDVERIFDDIIEACKDLGISLIGGHTEITHDLRRPIVVGQMLGEVKKDRMVRTSGARVGDAARNILQKKLSGRKIQTSFLSTPEASSKIIVRLLAADRVQLTSQRFY